MNEREVYARVWYGVWGIQIVGQRLNEALTPHGPCFDARCQLDMEAAEASTKLVSLCFMFPDVNNQEATMPYICGVMG